MGGGLLASALASLRLRGGWGQRRLASTACGGVGAEWVHPMSTLSIAPGLPPAFQSSCSGSGGAGVAFSVLLFGDPALERTGQGDQHPALQVEVTPDSCVPECGDYSGTGGHAQVGVELVMRTERDLDEVQEFLATLAGAPFGDVRGNRRRGANGLRAKTWDEAPGPRGEGGDDVERDLAAELPDAELGEVLHAGTIPAPTPRAASFGCSSTPSSGETRGRGEAAGGGCRAGEDEAEGEDECPPQKDHSRPPAPNAVRNVVDPSRTSGATGSLHGGRSQRRVRPFNVVPVLHPERPQRMRAPPTPSDAVSPNRENQSSVGLLLLAFRSDRIFFSPSRASFAARLGFVALRFFFTTSADRTRSASRSIAA